MNPTHALLDIAPEVQAALAQGQAVVALESTIISHGMPFPQNVETALRVEAEVRAHGAVPATVAIVQGRLQAGLSAAQIERLGRAGHAVPKVSRRDMVLRGWMINAVNPKGTVFMLAVVPQFLVLEKPLPLQYLVIGASLSFTDLVVMAGYTLLASRLLSALKEPRHIRALNRTFGSLFVGAGTLLALFKRAAT